MCTAVYHTLLVAEVLSDVIRPRALCAFHSSASARLGVALVEQYPIALEFDGCKKNLSTSFVCVGCDIRFEPIVVEYTIRP